MKLSTHRHKWEDCQRCPLHLKRANVVLFRGCCPAPLLFVGEAPGESEDIIGKPFIGPAGKLFDQLIEPIEAHIEYGVTNVVACIPRTYLEGSSGIRPPKNYESTQCLPRLKEIINLVSPSVICSLGVTAAKWIDAHIELRHHLKLTHPSSILRAEPSEQSLMVKRFQVTLVTKLSELGLLDG